MSVLWVSTYFAEVVVLTLKLSVTFKTNLPSLCLYFIKYLVSAGLSLKTFFEASKNASHSLIHILSQQENPIISGVISL